MLTSSGLADIIAFFVQWVWDTAPNVWPSVIMTNRDQAQMVALMEVYPHSRIFLCTWHVLRVIRSHFVTAEFDVLWEKIKAWVITENLTDFWRLWEEISADQSAPQSIINYLKTEWLPISDMWSRVPRKNRFIFEEGNTNMLCEAYVIHFQSACDNLIDLIKVSSRLEIPLAGWEAQLLSGSFDSHPCL